MGINKESSKVSEVTERYLYEVTRKLPEDQRKDVAHELRGIIEDTLLERAGNSSPTEKELETVLIELGNPRDLANQYKENKGYLISPTYYDMYVLVLQIVMWATLFSIVLSSMINYVTDPHISIARMLIDFIVSLLTSAVMSFANVTIIFALIEKYNKKAFDKFKTKKEWSVSDLKKIPHEKAIIKKFEPITGIIFAIIGMVLLNYAPGIIGVYTIEDTTSVIPIFNLELLKSFLPLFNIVFGLSILEDSLKMIAGEYSVKLSLAITLLSAASLIIIVFIFSISDLFNPECINKLYSLGLLPTGKEPAYYFDNIVRFFAGIIIFAYVLDIGTSLWKGFKYTR